jgi:hypothetical protein
MAHIRFASVAWPYSVAPASERDRSIQAKIGLDSGVETVNVPGRVVHRVGRKSNAVKTERTDL